MNRCQKLISPNTNWVTSFSTDRVNTHIHTYCIMCMHSHEIHSSQSVFHLCFLRKSRYVFLMWLFWGRHIHLISLSSFVSHTHVKFGSIFLIKLFDAAFAFSFILLLHLRNIYTKFVKLSPKIPFSVHPFFTYFYNLKTT